jgi:hypothetical protein
LLSRTNQCCWKKGGCAEETGDSAWFQRALNGLKDGAGAKLVSDIRG